MSIKLKIRPVLKQVPKHSEASDNAPPTPLIEKQSVFTHANESNPVLEEIENIFRYSLNLTNKQKDNNHESGLEPRDRVMQSHYKYAEEETKND